MKSDRDTEVLKENHHHHHHHPLPVLLMEAILHQLSHYLQGFIHPNGGFFSPDFNSYHHHATHRSHRPDPSAPDFPGHFSDPPWIPSNPTIWGTSPFSSAAFRTQDGPLEKPVISKVQYTTPFFWGYNFRYPKCQQKKHAKNVPKKNSFLLGGSPELRKWLITMLGKSLKTPLSKVLPLQNGLNSRLTIEVTNYC